MAPSIHPTAIVDRTAEIAADVRIGPYCVVGENVTIGTGCDLFQQVSIMKNTVLGERNTVYPGTVLGADPQDKKYAGEDTWLHIGSENTIRENVTVNRGTAMGGRVTRLGSRCLIMASAHIAHDCILGDEITMANAVLLGGHVAVEDGVGFGGLCAIHHFATIGRHSFVGGTARVSKDVPPYLITEGHPARVRAVNRVGLQRRGITEEVISWLKEAQRLIFHEGAGRGDAQRRLEQERGPTPPEGEILFEFLRRQERGKQGRALQP